jgi:peptide deformylase
LHFSAVQVKTLGDKGGYIMAIMDIVKYGAEVLREKAEPVSDVNDDIRTLVKDMLESMYKADGVGLAAEQIGRKEAICVIDVPQDDACGVKMPLVLINPVIRTLDGEQCGQEGCLSFPGIYVQVKRAQKAIVDYMDMEGNKATVEATGLLSRALQHEIDHLHGVLLVDKMTAVQKVAHAGKLKRLKKGRL